MRNPGYDPVAGFTPIAMVDPVAAGARRPATSGIRSTRELIEAMRKEPGKLSYGSGGAGSVSHLAGELLKLRTGTFAVHVPYRGAVPAITALIAGDVQFAFLTYTGTSSFIASGRLRRHRCQLAAAAARDTGCADHRGERRAELRRAGLVRAAWARPACRQR